MGKVLFLLDELPPTKSANGICVDKIINELNKDGIGSSCICWKAPPQYKSEVHLIPEKPWKKKVDRFSSGGRFSLILFQVMRIAYRIKRIFLIPLWPVDSCKTVRDYYHEAVKLIEAGEISVVVAVNYPGETLLAMKKLKKHYGDKIKTVMYPLDVSYINPYCGKVERKLSAHFCPQFMKNCSDYADVLLTLENAQETYMAYYSEEERGNFKICGIPLLDTIRVMNTLSTPGEVHCLYSGTLQKHVRDPKIAFCVMNEITKSISDKIIFDLCGQIDWESKKIYEEGQFAFKLIEHGWLSENQLNTFLENTDVLISLGNMETHLIPSKLFKYMATGKPIVHFCLTERDPCIPYLKKYGNAYIVYSDDISRKEKINELKQFIDARKSASIDLRTAFPRCFPDYTENILKEML